MMENAGTPSNQQEAIAQGVGSLAIAAAAYANVTVYQYILRSEDGLAAKNLFSDCPYPGLEMFRTADARFFAGRDDKIAELVGAVDRHRIIGSIAASGAGKSSLVHAGLIPRLAAREGEHWDVFAFRPGQDPIYSLARSISGVLADGADLDSQLNEIRRNVENLRALPGRLAEYVEEISRRRVPANAGKRHNILFVVDQWEELYTQAKLADDRKALLRELLDVTERGQAKLVLTMRADFMPELLSDDTEFFHRLELGIRFLGPMSESERRAAIVMPAKAVGLSVPEALVTRLVMDTGDSSGSLAYLQFVLRKLWEERDKTTNSLTASAYDRMNGLRGAIGAHASSVFSQLSAEEQVLAERVIPRLVNVPEAGSPTSRRLPFSVFDGPARILLRKLAGQERRLIVLSAATERTKESETLAEVAHEALLREWKELKDWINDRGAFYRLRNKIEADAATWMESNKNPDLLIAAGKQLRGAQDLLGRALLGEASEALQDFIRESVVKRAAEEKTRQDEQLARRASELQHIKRITLRNRWLTGLAAFFVASIIGLGYFWQESELQRETATRRAAILSIDAAEKALSEGGTDKALSMLLESAATIGPNSPPERLIIALENAIERASSERRILVPVSSIPFVIGNRLYLHVPETGEVLIIDSSGGPRAAFNLPGRVLLAKETLTTLGVIIVVKAEENIEFWSLPEATNRPQFLARQRANFQGKVAVEIGLDGRAMLYADRDGFGSPPFQREVFDLVQRQQEVLELGEYVDRFFTTATGTSYPSDASEDETLAAFERLGFASVRYEDYVEPAVIASDDSQQDEIETINTQSDEIKPSDIQIDDGLGLTRTCFGADLPKALELGLIDAIGSLQLGNEFDADCSIHGDFVHVSLLSSVDSGRFRTTIVATVSSFLDGILTKDDFAYGPIPGRISGVYQRFPSIVANEDGYSLVEPQVRSLYYELNERGYDFFPDGQLRVFAHPIDAVVMLTRDTAAVLLAPNREQSPATERELVFINFDPKKRYVDLSEFESDDPLAEWLAERQVAAAQPWVDFGSQDGSDQELVGPGQRSVKWAGETDSNGFRSGKIDSTGPDAGEWRFPYKLLMESLGPEAPPVWIRLSPSGAWYAALAGEALTVYSRDGVPLVSRRVQNRYVRFSFVNLTDPSILFADPDSSLLFWRDAGAGEWVEEEIYSAEFPIVGIDVPSGGQRVILTLELGLRRHVLRRLHLPDLEAWPDIKFYYYLPEILPLSDGGFLFDEYPPTYRVIDPPDVADLVDRADKLISPHCRDAHNCR